MELLKDGGRAAIVLPDGTLVGEGIKTRIKKKMLEECNLHTIVRLPKSVFAPYTSIATNILFLTKGEPTRDVWYYEHQLPDGVKAYNKTKPMRHSEFEEEKNWWNTREETPKAWRVSAKDIAANNYNLDIKNPNAPVETHDDPDELLAQYEESVKAAKSLQDQLRTSLQQSLGH
jgi:type I restriction enzyme M protein